MGINKDKSPSAKVNTPRIKAAQQRLDHELTVYQIEMEQQNTELRRVQEELEGQQIELERQNEYLVRVQSELEMSRNTYAELYDFAPVGYFTFSALGHIQKVNLTGAQLLGTERQLLVSKHFSAFIADANGSEIFSRHLKTVMHNHEMQRCEIRLTGKNGSEIIGRFQSVAVYDREQKEGHILSSIIDASLAMEDITARRQSEDLLLKAGALQSAIFNSANFSSIATDAKGVIQIFNVGAERMLGYTAAEVLNKITPANMMLVEDLISRRPDIRFLGARDAIHGIEIAISSLPDAILMDINLPGISGRDALKILKNDPATAHIPIIALSANAIPRDIEQGLKSGFFKYLTKPIKVNEFMATLDMTLKYAKEQQ